MIDITPTFFKNLFIPKEILSKKPKRSFSNSIFFRSYSVFGKQGSGKTEFMRSVAEKAKKFYGSKNVNSVLINNGDLSRMFESIDDRLVNLFYIDDLTLVKINEQDLSNFFRSRHLVKEKTGRSNGYIMVFLGMHRFHGIPEELRTGLDGIVIKDSAFNDYDRNWLKRKYGEEIIVFMDRLRVEKVYNPKLYEIGFYWGDGICGMINVPQANKESFIIPEESINENIHSIYYKTEGLK